MSEKKSGKKSISDRPQRCDLGVVGLTKKPETGKKSKKEGMNTLVGIIWVRW